MGDLLGSPHQVAKNKAVSQWGKTDNIVVENVLIAANGGRSSTGGCSSVVYHQDDNDDKLGLLKPYLAATNNNEKHGSVLSSKPCFLLPNLRMFPRFFSSHTQPPKNKSNISFHTYSALSFFF
ncbi:hypothetical protein OSB04_001458 [Centaurea solstitialis]|uniref:Uncharacterized protein n=1 Tax=Centaurea solstitialis TaxID=347529 RepID=A0AA38WLR6_9ASTR|nr:hypothetical protein OSB04_001458 [Centaurea solstitialis]